MLNQDSLLPEAGVISLIGFATFVVFLLLELHYRRSYNTLTLPEEEEVDRFTYARLEERGEELYNERKEANKHEQLRSLLLVFVLGLLPWGVFYVIASAPGILGDQLLVTIMIIISFALACATTALMLDLMVQSARWWYKAEKPEKEQSKVAAAHRRGVKLFTIQE